MLVNIPIPITNTRSLRKYHNCVFKRWRRRLEGVARFMFNNCKTSIALVYLQGEAQRSTT